MKLLLRGYCYARKNRRISSVFAMLLLWSYAGLAQKDNATISFEAKEVRAATVLKEIERQTESTLTYNQEEINSVIIKRVSWDHVPLQQALKSLGQYGIVFSIAGNNIALKLAPVRTSPKPPATGKITGKIVDEETGESLSGVTVKIGESYTTSDIDGVFAITLPKGKYTAVVTSVGYGAKNVTDIELGGDKVVVLNLTLKRERGTLAGVVVSVDARKETVTALYARQKNNAAITDGISAEQISRTPDRNVGETLKRVSGLSTMDNRYIVVRGLSERYNGAVLNGQLMPSTELNRKNFSFDLLPTNLVENITVIKTLTPDRSAEFGGGLIEVNTIEVPTRDFLTISLGSSVNEKTTGKPFLSLPLEGREYFGGVAKSRYLFGTLDWRTGNDAVRYYAEHGSTPNLFSNNWGITSMKAQPSQNYQLTFGRVIKAAGGQLGITASATYRNTLNRVDINWGREGWVSNTSDNSSGNALLGAEGKRYDFTTNLGGLFGIAYRNGNHRISFQSLYLRTLSQQLSILYSGIAPDGKGNWGMYDMTTQTTLWQQQLKGEHQLNKKGLKFNWLGSYIYLDKQRPDNHILVANVQASALAPDSNNISVTSPQTFYGYNRVWSRALEKNGSWDASLSVPFTINDNKQSFKVGYAGWYKDRLFFVLNSNSLTSGGKTFSTPLSSVYSPDYLTGISFPPSGDSIHKKATLHAFYGMFDNRLGNKWRLVWGVRGEYIDMDRLNDYLEYQERHTTDDLSNWKNKEKKLQLFPSANLTYSLTRQMNLRLAYARSIIRPDLRELAYFYTFDYELGGEYGGADVRSTLVDHFDFRYEWYPAAGDVVSLTGFYKHLHYPMEIFQQPNRFFQLKNSKEAQNYGVEIEARKSLAFTEVPVIRNLTLYGNFTYMDARVRPMQIRAVRDSLHPARTTPVEEVLGWEKRPQAGASNYIFNAGIYFDSRIIAASLVYNSISNRTVRVTDHGSNNVSTSYQSYYEQPARNLDAQVAVRLLRQRLELKLNAANLLNSFSVIYRNYDTPDKDGNLTKRQAEYKKDLDFVDYRSVPGRTYSTTITYRF